MKIFYLGSHQFRESLREWLRELWFSYCSSRGVPFREQNFVFRECNFEFRELIREYPGSLREFREWLFHSESVFPEIGVVPHPILVRKTHSRLKISIPGPLFFCRRPKAVRETWLQNQTCMIHRLQKRHKLQRKWHFPASKSVVFVTGGVAEICRKNPVICTVKCRFLHPKSGESYRRIL